MIWLLILINLGGDPLSVRHAEIMTTYYSEQECIKRIQEIKREEGGQLPPNVNIGCVSYKRKAM